MTTVSHSTRPTVMDAGLKFSAFGYFTRPIERDATRQIDPDDLTNWLQLEELINRLKSGDFSAADALLMLCRHSRDWRLKAVGTRVLGHAAPSECFREMRRELDALPLRTMDAVDVKTREMFLLYCRAFCSWGRLDVVPVLLDYYITLRLKRTPDISLLPLLIGQLLVGEKGSMIPLEPPEDNLEDYLNLVMVEYETVAERLGSDKRLVFRGALQSVRGFAQSMRQLATDYPSVELTRLRERFEPATGWDCSVIFEGTSVSTLAAAAIAEEFLESPEAERYEPGRRYFFGHGIPDE